MSGFDITGWGTAVPDQVLTSVELAGQLGVDEDWIVSRCGIRERRIVAPGQTTASLAVTAGQRAIERAGLRPEDIAHLVVATATPEQPSPATSAFVHHGLGLTGSAHDVNAECSGFVYALLHAVALLSIDPRPILVIGSDTHSLSVDPSDRDLRILVGDGAGALVVQPGPENRLLGSNLGADGSCTGSLQVLAGGSRMPTTTETARDGLHYARINGNEIYLNAVRFTVRSVRATLEQAKVEPAQVQHIVPHQANIRIINSVLKHAGLPGERLITNLERYGNTASASIPIALSEALDAGTVRDDDLVLLAGFGAGMTWASMLIRWGGARL